MKKLIVGLFVAVLMAAGLVSASGGTAAAAGCDTSYTGCFKTKTKIKAPSSIGAKERITVCVKVKAKGSNAKPTGTVRIKIKKIGGGYKEIQSSAYSGGKVCFKSNKLRPGSYTIFAKFHAAPGSSFDDSSDADGFTVKKRKH